MPYCPKCDMEFVDEITQCSDCGGPLAESEVAAKAAIKKQQEEEQYAQQLAAEQLKSQKSSLDAITTEDIPESEVHMASAGVYIKKEQKYEDLKSSASAFIIVSAVLLVISLLFWLGVINMPMTGITKLIFQTALTAMGIFALLVSINSNQSAKKLAPQIAAENKATKELIQWFITTHNTDSIDSAIPEAAELAPEELSLKRFQLIQDYLIISHDLPDSSYVDALSEDIYSKLYD